ncbi:MAG TPA: cytochrome c oxidase assembly protein [Mucilaginibacter sp.]|nr:cytochrome c oxidase assembly protein [Mucilaginibacter sp.]
MKNILLILHWQINIPALLLAGMMGAAFYMLTGFRNRKNTVLFITVISLLLLLVSSPLYYLGMHNYLSAHMVIHVLLLLVFGPLLVLSLGTTEHPSLHRLSRFCKQLIWVAWMFGVGVMWFWHIPALFNMNMSHQDSLLSFLQTGSLLLAGILFSWPLLGPVKQYHAHALTGIVYLFTACVSCSLLGLLITFAPVGTYHHLQMSGPGEANPWHLTDIQDSRAAGLIMWVPCCFVYLSGCLWLLYRWFAETSIIKLNNA